MRELVVALVAIVAMAGAVMSGPGAAEAVSVWGCAPVSLANSGGGATAILYIYNGSVTTANVAAKWLTKTGTNLAGVQIPGAPGGILYPGQTGATTVPVAAGNTLVVPWSHPITDGALSGNAPTAIRVVSDQPVIVGVQNQFTSGAVPVTCGILD